MLFRLPRMAPSAACVIAPHADADVQSSAALQHTQTRAALIKGPEEAGNNPASPNLSLIKLAEFCGIQDFRRT